MLKYTKFLTLFSFQFYLAFMSVTQSLALTAPELEPNTFWVGDNDVTITVTEYNTDLRVKCWYDGWSGRPLGYDPTVGVIISEPFYEPGQSGSRTYSIPSVPDVDCYNIYDESRCWVNCSARSQSSGEFVANSSSLITILRENLPIYDEQQWEKHGAVIDPIASGEYGGTRVYEPTVIKDGTIFKLWYVGMFNSKLKIGYAESNDGVNWNDFGTVLNTSSIDGVDENHLRSSAVVKIGSTYHMWYVASSSNNAGTHLMYATSTNGTNWDKQGSLYNSRDYGHGVPSSPSISWDGFEFEMWLSVDYGVRYFTSEDGQDWTDQGAVLNIGPETGVSDPVVLKLGPTNYEMWYKASVHNWSDIAYAISMDGITWEKKGIVLSRGATGDFDKWPYSPVVIRDGGSYKMWYAGFDSKISPINFCIGYATSSVTIHDLDGDLAPLGAPDGKVNVADLIVGQRIIHGAIPITDQILAHGDLYPPGAPNGVFDFSDLILLEKLVHGAE